METDYAIGEWWTGHRRIEGDELAGVYRRMAKRGNVQTDEPIGPHAPVTLTIVRPTRAETLRELKNRDARRRGVATRGETA